jgi:hypothetical protein
VNAVPINSTLHKAYPTGGQLSVCFIVDNAAGGNDVAYICASKSYSVGHLVKCRVRPISDSACSLEVIVPLEQKTTLSWLTWIVETLAATTDQCDSPEISAYALSWSLTEMRMATVSLKSKQFVAKVALRPLLQ